MAYHIPSDDQVLEALKRVISRRRVIDSQRKLKSLVERELSKQDGYRVGEVRLRRLTIESGLIDLQVECRESGIMRSLIKCPVCAHRLRRVINRTVFGGTVTLGYDCPHCPYWTGLKIRIPSRYIFTRRRK